eukprot:GHVU01007652.1.p1 GENE.GHVU01007652.1~~GHVU01007652.1.p1  ORF type:complete len:168 (+),score=33.70 GHVU01007652.1:1211-1714(+)
MLPPPHSPIPPELSTCRMQRTLPISSSSSSPSSTPLLSSPTRPLPFPQSSATDVVHVRLEAATYAHRPAVLIRDPDPRLIQEEDEPQEEAEEEEKCGGEEKDKTEGATPHVALPDAGLQLPTGAVKTRTAARAASAAGSVDAAASGASGATSCVCECECVRFPLVHA